MKIGGVIFAGDYYIEHNQNGINTLGFDIYFTDSAYEFCKVNTIVEDTQIYKIMQIDDNGKYLSVDCTLNLDEFKSKFFIYKNFVSKTLNQILLEIIPTGWTVLNANRPDLNTIELKTTTSFAALDTLQRTFGCYFKFDNIKKQLTVIYPDTTRFNGNYLSTQLNTLSAEYSSDSYGLINRVYPIGKNGLTIASVNNGLEYVENLQFNSVPISASVSNDKINDPYELKKFAEYELNEKYRPKESYKFKIINLSKIDKSDYSLKNLEVHSLIKYLDSSRKKEVFHVVTKYKEFPLNPNNDEITLSSEITSVSSTVNGSVNVINNSIENTSIRTFNNAVNYTDGKIEPLQNSINIINGQISSINSKLAGYTGTIALSGYNLRFENGILKGI